MALPGLPEPPSEIGHAGVWCLGGDRYQEADEPGDCAGNDPGEGSNEPGSFVSLRLPKHARQRQAGGRPRRRRLRGRLPVRCQPWHGCQPPQTDPLSFLVMVSPSTDCRTGLMDERSRRRTLSCRAIRLKLVQRALGTFPNTGPKEIPATQRRTRCYQATQPRRVLATNM
jgi:hypothetical protein